MKDLSEGKKIATLGIILLILAGIIVVALKGMNVDLMFTKHKSVNLTIGKEFDIKEVEEICKEIFKNKNIVLRKIGTFGDSINVNVSSISDEEKDNLIKKINEKYALELDTSKILVNSDSNVRIRDFIKPYILPAIITFVGTYLYIGIRYRKLNSLKILLQISAIILVTELGLSSIVAITRIPVSPVIINLLFVIAIAEIIVFIYKKEKELETV